MGWVPWQRPGFDLGLQLEKCLNENPVLEGLFWESWGFYLGRTSYESYINSLKSSKLLPHYIEDKVAKNSSVFGGQKSKVYLKKGKRKAAQLAPILEVFLRKCNDRPFY